MDHRTQRNTQMVKMLMNKDMFVIPTVMSGNPCSRKKKVCVCVYLGMLCIGSEILKCQV